MGKMFRTAVGLLLLVGVALPSQAEARWGYDMMAEPWVKVTEVGDAITVYGALFDSHLPGEKRPRPDRVELQQRVVGDGAASWEVRATQRVKMPIDGSMTLDLRWLVPPSLGAARVRTVAYRGKTMIANSGWRRLGLRHLTAESLAESSCAIQAGGAPRCWTVKSWPTRGNPYRARTLTSRSASTLGQIKQKAGNCVLRLSGQVACWGDNFEQIVGDGSRPPTARQLPVSIPGMDEVSLISSSSMVNCAVKVAGPVWCWGIGESGSMGTGKNESRTHRRPVLVKGLSSPRMISTGGFETCVVTAEATVSCWGPHFRSGRDSVPHLAPTPIQGLEDVVEVGVGEEADCALVASGQVYCWGINSFGTVGDGTRKNRFAPTPLPGLTDATDISVGSTASCAVRKSGQAVCWGMNYDDRLGVGLGVKVLTPTPVPGLDDAREITTDGGTTCAIRTGDEVWCWGFNTYGAVGNGNWWDGLTDKVPVPVRTG